MNGFRYPGLNLVVGEVENNNTWSLKNSILTFIYPYNTNGPVKKTDPPLVYDVETTRPGVFTEEITIRIFQQVDTVEVDKPSIYKEPRTTNYDFLFKDLLDPFCFTLNL